MGPHEITTLFIAFGCLVGLAVWSGLRGKQIPDRMGLALLTACPVFMALSLATMNQRGSTIVALNHVFVVLWFVGIGPLQFFGDRWARSFTNSTGVNMSRENTFFLDKPFYHVRGQVLLDNIASALGPAGPVVLPGEDVPYREAPNSEALKLDIQNIAAAIEGFPEVMESATFESRLISVLETCQTDEAIYCDVKDLMWFVGRG